MGSLFLGLTRWIMEWPRLEGTLNIPGFQTHYLYSSVAFWMESSTVKINASVEGKIISNICNFSFSAKDMKIRQKFLNVLLHVGIYADNNFRFVNFCRFSWLCQMSRVTRIYENVFGIESAMRMWKLAIYKMNPDK